MSTHKEAVTTYFGDWNGKGVNSQNGATITNARKFSNIGWWIECEGCDSMAVYPDSSEGAFVVAARILKLDRPMAKGIDWETLPMDRAIGDNGEYLIKPSLNHPDKLMAVDKNGCDVGSIALFGSMWDAKAACQANKQKRFNQLGGYTNE